MKHSKCKDPFDEINFEESHTNSGRSNSGESQNIASGVLLDIFSEITELGDSNWLF